MTRRVRSAWKWACLSLVILGCAENRNISIVPPDSAPADVVEVFVATNRDDISEPGQQVRAARLRHLRVDVRIPPAHREGTLSLPRGAADPDTDFMAETVAGYPDAQWLVRDIRSRLNRMTPKSREIVLYVHGYNTTFAKGVMRLAQLNHDLGQQGVVAHFSWPSSGSALGYAYDRDSVLFSRDALASFMRALSRTDARILLVGHSMGAQLAMESLRQIELTAPGWGRRNLAGVVLLSPDIDVDVFRSQVLAIGDLPQPFILFVSDRDRVLGLSSLVSQDTDRLGRLTDPRRIADLEVTMIDVSDYSSGTGHFNLSTSPALIRILQRLGRVETALLGEATGPANLPEGVVMTVQNVTTIILSPLNALR